MGRDKHEQKETEPDWCSVDVKRYFKSCFLLHDSSKYCLTCRVYMTHFHMLWDVTQNLDPKEQCCQFLGSKISLACRCQKGSNMGSFDRRNQQDPSADIIFCNIHYFEKLSYIKNLEKVNSSRQGRGRSCLCSYWSISRCKWTESAFHIDYHLYN